MIEKKDGDYCTRFNCVSIMGNELKSRELLLIHETPIDIFINGISVVRTQCLAKDVEQMAVGFAFCEGFLQKRADLKSLNVDMSSGRAELEIDMPSEKLEDFARHERVAAGGGRTALISRSGMAIRTLPEITSKLTIDAERLLRFGNEFNDFVGLYRDSKFVHSAALADNKEILNHFEDVGRHNALDKAIGYAFQNGLDFDELMLLCSGRFSLEMVTKAACLGVPIYVSPAAASVDAVNFAESIGMTLCGRVKPGAANIYSAAWRVTPGEKK